jgi:predicted nucleic acid-binding Zn ribbon protein
MLKEERKVEGSRKMEENVCEREREREREENISLLEMIALILVVI